MAPSRPSGGRAGPSKPGKNSNKRGGKPVGSKSGSKSSSSGVSKPRSKSTPSKKGAPARKSIEQLTKGIAKQPTKKKRRTYTEKELGIPALNMITPAGVSKPKGKKKGKVFVDDRESMMTILAMVNADKEGQIESKMMKARQLEEIRQARAKEMEARQAMRKDKLVRALQNDLLDYNADGVIGGNEGLVETWSQGQGCRARQCRSARKDCEECIATIEEEEACVLWKRCMIYLSVSCKRPHRANSIFLRMG